MPSTPTYLTFILDQLADVPDVSHRAMMGEYILYLRGKVVGGIYDDRLLLKPTPSAAKLLPDARRDAPYDGAKPMLLVENVEDRALLRALLDAVCEDLPR